jgi:hypothetical protein
LCLRACAATCLYREQANSDGSFDPITSPRFSLVYMDDPDDSEEDETEGEDDDLGSAMGVGLSAIRPGASHDDASSGKASGGGGGSGGGMDHLTSIDMSFDDDGNSGHAPTGRSGAPGGGPSSFSKRVTSHLDSAFDDTSPGAHKGVVGSGVDGEEDEEGGVGRVQEDVGLSPEARELQGRLDKAVGAGMVAVVVLNIALLVYVW